VVAGSLTQIDEVRSGSSYLSQNDFRIHFGLGNAEKIERVEIRWPSGTSETLQNLAANRFYFIKEGEGVVPPDSARPVPAKAAQTGSQAPSVAIPKRPIKQRNHENFSKQNQS
jgi:enediyne biosynthesis protein E4